MEPLPQDSMETSARLELEAHPEIVAVATTTFYPNWKSGEEGRDEADKVRGDLALSLVRITLEAKHQLVVVDGGSSEAFLEALTTLGLKVHPQEQSGMSASRRQAFQEAEALPSARAIVWTEPEKVSFASKECLTLAVLPVLQGVYDIVVPKRREESLSTLPPAQASYEKRFNARWTQLLRITGLWKSEETLDVAFGPRIFRNTPEVTRLFQHIYSFSPSDGTLHTHVRTESYPNATFFPVIAALHRGFRVGSVPVPYHHPEEQTILETGDPTYEAKRQTQYFGIVTASKHFIDYLRGNKQKSHIERVW